MLKDSKMSRRDGADLELEEAISIVGFQEECEAHMGIGQKAKKQSGTGLRYPYPASRFFSPGQTMGKLTKPRWSESVR